MVCTFKVMPGFSEIGKFIAVLNADIPGGAALTNNLVAAGLRNTMHIGIPLCGDLLALAAN